MQEVLMSTDVIASILQAHSFAEGFWPDHIARLSAMASVTITTQIRAGAAVAAATDEPVVFGCSGRICFTGGSGCY